jgi:hypothetical protein
MRWQILPLEELVHRELHQYIIPETRAGYPVSGERLPGTIFQDREPIFGYRGAEIACVAP